jgi:hypothetical protein
VALSPAASVCVETAQEKEEGSEQEEEERLVC